MDYRMIALKQFCSDAKKTKDRVSISSALAGADEIEIVETCKLSSKCNRPAKYNVIHKAVGAMPERHVKACEKCAGRVGGGIKENRFYKVVEL